MDKQPLTVYTASVTCSREIQKKQSAVVRILESKKIPFENVDICQADNKDKMREKLNNPTALAPQIFNGDAYCGDYNAFENAVEEEKLEEFLKIKKE